MSTKSGQKRKAEKSVVEGTQQEPASKQPKQLAPTEVWIAFHQLEAAYGGVGDWGYEEQYMSHAPKTFDKKVLGVFTTRAAANRCAQAKADALDLRNEDDEDEDEDNEGRRQFDFVGEGLFRDGADSGDVNTFSQRVHVERHVLRE